MMKEVNTMFKKLQKLLSEEFHLEKEEITLDKSFVDDLGVDSIDLFSLIEVIEKEFEISIPDDINIYTVEDMIVTIERLQQEAKN